MHPHLLHLIIMRNSEMDVDRLVFHCIEFAHARHRFVHEFGSRSLQPTRVSSSALLPWQGIDGEKDRKVNVKPGSVLD